MRLTINIHVNGESPEALLARPSLIYDQTDVPLPRTGDKLVVPGEEIQIGKVTETFFTYQKDGVRVNIFVDMI